MDGCKLRKQGDQGAQMNKGKQKMILSAEGGKTSRLGLQKG
jgi:hypothetical protein